MHHASLARQRGTRTTRSVRPACLLWLLISNRWCKVDFQIRLHHTDCLFGVGLHFQHGDFVDGFVVGKGEDITHGETGKVAESRLEHGFGIADFEKVCVLWLQSDEGAEGQIGRLGLEEIARLEMERLHEPVWEICTSFFGCEFKNTSMCAELL